MFGMEKTGRAEVFIVDDMEINRIVLEEIIREMDCEPVSFASGEEALAQLRSLWKKGGILPRLILTDISMPGMDGFELCRILKGHENTRSIPIIFISAYNNSSDIVEGFSKGCEDYITKPFISEEVKARVGLHLKLHAVTRELREMNRHLQVSVREQVRQMEQEKKNFLCALAGIVERSAGYDSAFMERLKSNCRTLAQGMQLSPMFEEKISDTFIDTIELAAALCDIGYLGVAERTPAGEGARGEALAKAEPAGEDTLAGSAQEERRHTLTGAKLISDLQRGSEPNDFLGIAQEIIHYHHENWDGSGYPEGRKEEEIPLSARIVSVVSRYCELTGKEGFSRQEALGQMEKEVRIRFDPDIYRICCRISRQLR